MMEPYREKVKEYRGYEVWREIDDEGGESPREWYNLGTMYCGSGRYHLGDIHIHGEDDMLTRLLSCYVDELGSNPWAKVEKDYLYLPLYLYDHGGITMSTGRFSCPWDSGMVGYIAVHKARLRAEYRVKRISGKLRKMVIGILEKEVEIYDSYLTGDTWGFLIFDPDGNEVDALWGFYGDDMGYLDKVEGIVDADIIEKNIEKEEKLLSMYTMAR